MKLSKVQELINEVEEILPQVQNSEKLEELLGELNQGTADKVSIENYCYFINVRETPQGFSIDVFDNKGDEIRNSYTFWNEDIEVKYPIRCNNCNTYFEGEDDLKQMEDGRGNFKGCPECETDSYLIDLH